jgi:protein ImuA
MPTPAVPPPEHIHPALWRGTQLAQAARATVPTGHPVLTKELPGGGWPPGALNELLLPRPGIGEMRLLQPALATLDKQGSIVLVQPPCVPHIAAWSSWGLDPARLLWVNPARPADALWAAEQVLKNGGCAALLCWLPEARPESLRRLHLAAQAGATLFFCLRPARTAGQASPAPLRLALAPSDGGVVVDILKRRGPVCGHSLYIALETPRTRPTPVEAPSAPQQVPSTPQEAPFASQQASPASRQAPFAPQKAPRGPRIPSTLLETASSELLETASPELLEAASSELLEAAPSTPPEISRSVQTETPHPIHV